MKLWKIVSFVTVALAVASCSTFRLSTYNSQPNYFNDKIVVNKINTMNQLRVQMQQDWSLRYNYMQFAIHQDMNWYYDYYYRNNLSRRGFGSAFDFYWNRYDIWWEWSFNSYNWWGYDWYKPYHYNPYYYNPYYWKTPTFKKGNDLAYMTSRRRSTINKVVDKIKTIIDRSYSNIVINTNPNNNTINNRNYNNNINNGGMKFTPRINPNNTRNDISIRTSKPSPPPGVTNKSVGRQK
tara:strand:- start:869 stop:1579 length:711 start_codon:yes stop_codon:yes gene_type:complete